MRTEKLEQALHDLQTQKQALENVINNLQRMINQLEAVAKEQP